MMSKNTYWNLFGFTALVLSIMLLVNAIVSTAMAADENLDFYTVITMSFDVVGMMVCITLFSSVFYDRRMTKMSYLFLLMVFEVISLLFFEFLSIRHYGDSDKYILQTITNYHIYALILLTMLTFWMYMKQQHENKDAAYYRIELAYYICFAIGIAVLLINPFNHMAFYIDRPSGMYVSGPLVAMVSLPFIAMIFMNAYCTRYFGEDRGRRIIVLASSAISLLALTVLSYSNDEASLCYVFVFTVFLIHGGFYVERGQELTRKDAEIVEQNITMMISQVQPYFLYNSLNSIAKMEGNPPETQKAVEDFAKYLRSNLNTLSQTSTIPFEKEMEHVRTYVDLEKLRFKEKLNVVYMITDEDFDIPPLTLQMLVENAIKHGITQREEGGTVTISTSETDAYHRITVSDNGVGFDSTVPPSDESRSHVGIINITERLSDLLDGTLKITSEIGCGTVAVVTIPKNTINPHLE